MDWRTLVLFCLIGGILAAKPALRPVNESVEKSQLESYVVFCTASGDKVTWMGPKGKEILLTSGRVHVEDRGSLGLALFLDRIEMADRGRYTCVCATDKLSAYFELSVVKTSKFVNTPTEHRVNEYQNTVIRCEVEGEPKPLITWQRNGMSLDITQTQKYVLDSKGLRVLNASKHDAGVFTCRALQVGRDDGFVESVDITLKVQHKPEWKETVTGSTVVYGYLTGESNLTCEALAQPEANYTWTRNGKEVKHLKLNLTEVLEHDKSILKIKIDDESLYGQYQCQAKNKLGHITRSFDLQKGEKPSEPTGFRVIDTKRSSAVLKIASEVPDLVGYRAQFVISRPGQEISWEQPDYQDIPKTDTGHYEIRDLLEDTPYTVRVAARSPAGLSDYTTDTVLLRTLKTGEVGSSSARSNCLYFLLLIALGIVATVH